ESRRAVMHSAISYLQRTLWSPAGEVARAYLQERWGLRDEEIKELALGLYGSTKEMKEALLSEGHVKRDLRASGILSDKLPGYIRFPWADETGQPLTLCGTWHAKVPPEGTPKKIALCNPKDSGVAWEHTKRSPLYYDRARRAGHKDVVLVEGITDAAVAQV